MNKLIVILAACIFAFTSSFFTGCERDAQAKNIMMTHTYSFTIISDFTVVNLKPASGATNVATDTNIECDVLHSLPFTSISMVVKAGANPVPGTLTTTNITGGKHLVFKPTSYLPQMTEITIIIAGEVDNGQ